jgi:hypothetical protein
MQDDDKGALKSSIDEGGIIQPLLVLIKPDEADGMFQVVDGCNRLDSTPPGVELDCVMIETDNPREVALECMGTGRKRSPGQRTLAYLMMHKKEVLKAAEIGAQIAAGKGGPLSNESGLKYGVYADFTTRAIAERLKVCQEDVVRAVELFRCMELKRKPEIGGRKNEAERALDLASDDDRETLSDMAAIYVDVLSGNAAIRDWKRSIGGKITTRGKRPDVKYTDLVLKGLNHLKTVFKAGAWHDIPSERREQLAEVFDEVVEMLPEELAVRLPRK